MYDTHYSILMVENLELEKISSAVRESSKYRIQSLRRRLFKVSM